MTRLDDLLKHLDAEGFTQTAKMLRKVRDLHLPDANFTETCGDCDQTWPCLTAEALGAEPEQSTRVDSCTWCDGTGKVAGGRTRSCPPCSKCGGTGKEPAPAGPIDTYMAKVERDWKVLQHRSRAGAHCDAKDIIRGVLDVLAILVRERGQ